MKEKQRQQRGLFWKYLHRVEQRRSWRFPIYDENVLRRLSVYIAEFWRILAWQSLSHRDFGGKNYKVHMRKLSNVERKVEHLAKRTPQHSTKPQTIEMSSTFARQFWPWSNLTRQRSTRLDKARHHYTRWPNALNISLDIDVERCRVKSRERLAGALIRGKQSPVDKFGFNTISQWCLQIGCNQWALAFVFPSSPISNRLIAIVCRRCFRNLVISWSVLTRSSSSR